MFDNFLSTLILRRHGGCDKSYIIQTHKIALSLWTALSTYWDYSNYIFFNIQNPC